MGVAKKGGDRFFEDGTQEAPFGKIVGEWLWFRFFDVGLGIDKDEREMFDASMLHEQPVFCQRPSVHRTAVINGKGLHIV